MRIPSLRWRFWSIGFVVVVLLTASMVVHAQFDDDTGPVGRVDDGDSSPPPGPTSEPFPGDEDTQQYPGPIGRVDERLPHPECDTCFTVPILDEYQIFEQIMTDEVIILPRMVPNPAPIQANEIRERVDAESGEDIWYIGTQAFVGPTDKGYWSDEAPLPTIELQRIKAKYEHTIMGVPGVHGFGIGPAGFVVFLAPEHALNTEQVPLFLDEVPVAVELRDNNVILRHHSSYHFRPVPMGARISAYRRGDTGLYIGTGTLGPVIVRDRPHVGSCCQLLSLTNGHVVKQDVEGGQLTANTVEVHQPVRNDFDLSLTRLGYVTKTFDGLVPCSLPTDLDCDRLGAPVNYMHINPDIAAINHGFYSSPFNTPTDLDPTRHLQESISSYINGPSGRIKAASRGHRHKVWGSRTAGEDTAEVYAVSTTQVVRTDIGLGPEVPRYQVCCVNVLEYETEQGDSGALVAYAGTGNRHIAGVVMGGGTEVIDDLVEPVTFYIRANDIMTAFRNDGYEFSHFWGTKSEYRRPSTTTCDLPDGC